MSREEVVARWIAQNDGQRSWVQLPRGLQLHYLVQAESLLDHIGEWLIPE
jgi:hypothetical protein